MLHIDVFKENYKTSNRLVVQKHKKIKDVSWWILVADSQNNLLSLKKVSVKKKLSLKLQIDGPENIRKNKVCVYLMADSYIGLDQFVRVNF